MSIAIITGASRGLGLALAEQLAPHYRTLITIARQANIASVSAIAKHHKHQHLHISADLSKPSDIERVCEQIPTLLLPSYNRYLLINNAGTLGPIAQFAGLPQKTSAIANTFHLNIAAVIALTSTFLATCQTQAAKEKSIQVVNISSGAGRSPYPGWGVYCASKAALDMYTQVAQLEAPFARLVALAPGVIDSDMQRSIRSSSTKDFPNVQRFKDLHANNALRSPASVAQKIAAYCLSEQFGNPIIDDIRLLKDSL